MLLKAHGTDQSMRVHFIYLFLLWAKCVLVIEMRFQLIHDPSSENRHNKSNRFSHQWARGMSQRCRKDVAKMLQRCHKDFTKMSAVWPSVWNGCGRKSGYQILRGCPSSPCTKDVKFGSKLGQINPKRNKSGTFSDHISVHLAHHIMTVANFSNILFVCGILLVSLCELVNGYANCFSQLIFLYMIYMYKEPWYKVDLI